ncbi:MAG: hypothetical protein GX194_04410 [Clostridium sp.]|nr:hypothetical protein [Clostridium sp.]
MVGNSLAAEILPTSGDLRCFVVIGAYMINENGSKTAVSKYLNAKNKENCLFWLRKYEVRKEYIENDWDVTQDELVNEEFITDIKSIEDLENELDKYLQDYSRLDLEWRCDNPL